jgi:hypothetical protein
MVESEHDSHEEEAGPSKKLSPPPAKKAKREDRKDFSAFLALPSLTSVQRRMLKLPRSRNGDTSYRRHS